MSHRLAMIVSIALTVLFGAGVYAARGQILGSQTGSPQETIVVQPDVDTIEQAAPPPRGTLVAPGLAEALDRGSAAGAEGDDDEHENGDDDDEYEDEDEHEDEDEEDDDD